VIDKRQSLPRFDYSRKNLRPVGSKVLILYVDKETFEVLYFAHHSQQTVSP
jgi:hypothetical protein